MNATPLTPRQNLRQGCITTTLMGIGLLGGAAWVGMALVAPFIQQVP